MNNAGAEAAHAEGRALKVTWQPTAAQVADSRLRRLMDRVGVESYAALQRWSIDDIGRFWDVVAGPNGDLDLRWQRPYERTFDVPDRGWAWTTWWRGGRFNYVHASLDRWSEDAGMRDQPALIWEGEEGATRTLTYAELRVETDRCARALQALGIGSGDRVGLFLPMIPEVVIAQLALGKIGAIYTPIFSGFGAEAVATRLQDCEARLLITCDGINRRGKLVPTKETADAAVALCPSVETVLVVDRGRRNSADLPWTQGRDVWWHDALGAQLAEPLAAAELDPEHPYMVIYTSGTTGKPKGVVHAHGGFPIKGAQDMAHSFDVGRGDRVFWLTDMGWMMGPWLVSGSLLLGATVVLFDGTPDYPDPGRLWWLVERHGITIMGVGPTAIRALLRHGDGWVQRHDRSALRLLGSSGEPWNPSPWAWFQDVVGEGRCALINYSGGTECSGGIVASTPINASKPTSFAGPLPGMDADVVDAEGRSVPPGEVGELVIRQPWPGMTRSFWRDDARYLEAYWSQIPGVWVHGDWASRDADGFWYIHGRSDDTIKVAGKRVGPAEVESAAATHPAVGEAAAIGVPDPVKGESVVVFVVLKPGCEPGTGGEESLADAISGAIVDSLGKSLKPGGILFVRELPKTRSGKIMRRVVRATYLDQPAGDLSGLDNASALDEIRRARMASLSTPTILETA